ncbi:MAG: beta-lactamase family protein [Labilithrix sp.]|nr:beta-lactamase family protein [Labilithrix sp.]
MATARVLLLSFAMLLGGGLLNACTAPLVVQQEREPRAGAKPAPEDEDDEDDEGPGDGPGSPGAAACGGGATAKVDTTALDPFFAAQMKAANVPGLSVAIIGGGKIKWAKGYGLANIAENKPVTPDTLFMLASVSKAVTAVALMQLIEKHGMSLDEDVGARLPFSVRHPSFASTPITYRMLLTHTSSLIDSDHYWSLAGPEQPALGDSPIPLLDFGRSYVARRDSWSRSKPGTTYAYSNTGASLVGLLVETISKKNLQDYSKATIFDPLGMSEASWFLRDLDPTHIAMPYEGSQPTPVGHYGYPDYPAGQLRTSAVQLARFLLMFAKNGECGQRVLSEASVEAMRTAQVPSVESTQGLMWYFATKGGTDVVGHNGGDRGVSTDMFVDPTTGSGYVLLSNGSSNTAGVASQEAAMAAMNDKLMELARTLP